MLFYIFLELFRSLFIVIKKYKIWNVCRIFLLRFGILEVNKIYMYFLSKLIILLKLFENICFIFKFDVKMNKINKKIVYIFLIFKIRLKR